MNYREDAALMERLIAVFGILVLLLTTLAPVWGAVNLKSSKSNIYRLTYPTDLVSQTQVSTMLADLDKLGRADETRLRQWLASNFRRLGIAADRIKKIVVLLPTKARDQTDGVADTRTWIILLTNPADESQAIAVTIKSTKSNTSD
jgi:hypothetical protein